MPQEEKIAEFVSQVDWRLYESIRFGFIAIRDKNRLLSLACHCSAEGSAGDEPGWSFDEEFDGLVAMRGQLPKSSLEAILTGAGSGVVTLGDTRLHLDSADQPMSWWHSGLRPRNFSITQWPHFEIQGTGKSIGDLAARLAWNTIEDRLLPLTRGRFRSIADLGRFLGTYFSEAKLDARSNATFRFFAPILVRTSSRTIDVGRRQLTVGVESRFRELPSDFEIYLSDGSGPSVFLREGLALAQAAGSSSLVAALPEGDGPWQLSLSACGKTIETTSVGVPTILWRTNLVFDGEVGWLDRLRGKDGSRTGDQFAHYVLSLFNLAGIAAVSYGHGKKMLNDAPDFVAELGTDSVLVCECKSDSPTPSEVEKLHARTDRVASHLGLRWTRQVSGALFTAVPREQISQDAFRRAHETGVFVVPRRNVEAFQAAIARGDSLDTSFDDLLGIRRP